jgi:hypothetical protein
LGVGSTTPWARFSIHANNGDVNTTLFAVASSTSGATTTLFAISNNAVSANQPLILNASGILTSTSTLAVNVGGTGATTLTSGQLIYGSGTGALQSVATSSASCSGGISCSAFTVVGSVSPIITSFSYPFPSNATSTSIAFNGGLTGTTLGLSGIITSTATAANVLPYASSTALTVSGGTYLGLTTGAANIGIGTTSPFAKLSLYAQNGDTGTTLFAVGSSTLSGTTNTSFFTINNTGQVTIGQNAYTGGGVSSSTQLTVLAGTTTAQRVGQATLNNNGFGIYVQDRYAYVTGVGTTNAFEIWDVSNISSPTRTGQGTLSATGAGIYVQGRYAYIVAGTSMEVWDISSPKTPVRLSISSLAVAGRSVYVQGRYAYLVDNDTTNSFEIWDVSNPAAPSRASQNTLTAAGESLYVQGRYAYIVDNSTTNAFEVWDVFNPVSPARVSRSTLNANGSGVYVQGRYAYLADFGTTNALEVWDVSDPTSPARTSQKTLTASGENLYVQGRYAYVVDAGTTNAFEVWDISSPGTPVRISQNTLNANGLWIFVQGRYAYFADNGGSSNALEIWDLGGGYIQQFEAGGLEAGTLSVRNSLSALDGAFSGGLNVAQSLLVGGSAAFVSATSTFNTTANIFNITTASSTSSILSVLGNGNVGIGTTSAAQLFSVSGNGYFTGGLGVGAANTSAGTVSVGLGSVGVPSYTFNGDSNTGVWSSGADTLNLSTGGSERVRVDSSGNVGLGTTSPNAGLRVESSTDQPEFTLFNSNTSLSTSNGLVQIQAARTSSSAFTLLNLLYGSNGTSGNGTSAFYVRGDGNIGIGSTSPSAHITSEGPSFDTNKMRFSNTGETSNIGLWDLGVRAPTASSDKLSLERNGSAMLSITNTGAVTLTSGVTSSNSGNYLCIDTSTFEVIRNSSACVTPSDQRLKQNIQNSPDANGLAAINALRPVTFTWKDSKESTSTQMGFIAQEFQQVFPTLVSMTTGTTTITLADGSAEQVFNALGVNYQGLVVPLVQSVQELDLNFQTLASTTATSTAESQSFAASFWNNVKKVVGSWLADAGNGIASIFAETVTAHVVNASQVCLADSSGQKTCIDKEQLDELLHNSSSNSQTTSGDSSGGSGSGSGGDTGTTTDNGSSGTSTPPTDGGGDVSSAPPGVPPADAPQP